jgi:hypothetical protein
MKRLTGGLLCKGGDSAGVAEDKPGHTRDDEKRGKGKERAFSERGYRQSILHRRSRKRKSSPRDGASLEKVGTLGG